MRRTSPVAATVALLLATLVVPVAADDTGSLACPDGAPPAGFADVPEGNVHATAIDCAVHLGIVLGTSETTFHPARSLTRGQAASLLARALDDLHVALPSADAAPGFSDVAGVHADAIHRLAAADVVEGRGDGRFLPNAAVSRDQLASLLVRALEVITGDEVRAEARSRFDDTAGSVHEANIDAAAEQGLLRGMGDGRYAPRDATRRDQAASVVVRLVERAAADLVGEIWSLDQGTDRIHVYRADERTEIATIDVSPEALQQAGFADAPTGEVTVPHMIEFDSRQRYAFIASTAGAVTLVVDARSKEVVEVLPTGAGSHHAAVTPDDESVWVAAIGAEQMVELALDLDGAAPVAEVARRLDVGDLLTPHEQEHGWTFPSSAPVCHQFSPDSSEAWVTLGPAWNQGGAFVLDLDSGTASHAFDPETVKANCGVSVTEDHAVLNFSGRVVEGDDTEGEWYVFDRESRQLLETTSSGGLDAHGLRLSPDGSTYWQVNRASDDAQVIDATTFEVLREVDDIADTPDILDFSPDGSLLYISQRGPNPRSGAIHAATGAQPGIAVVDTATDETVDVLEPPEVTDAEGGVLNDVHGVAARTRGTGDGPTSAEAASPRPVRLDRPTTAWTCDLGEHESTRA